MAPSVEQRRLSVPRLEIPPESGGLAMSEPPPDIAPPGQVVKADEPNRLLSMESITSQNLTDLQGVLANGFQSMPYSSVGARPSPLGPLGFEEEVRLELQRANVKLDLILRKAGLKLPRDRAASIISAQRGRETNSMAMGTSKSVEIRKIAENVERDTDAKRSIFADVLLAPPPSSRSDRKSTWERTISQQTEASDVPSQDNDVPNTPTMNGGSITFGEPTRQHSCGSVTASMASVDHRMEQLRQKQIRMTDIIRHHHRHTVFPCLDRVWRFIEYYDSSYPARLFNRFMPFFILFSVGFTLMQSMDKPPVKPVPAAIVETTIDSLYGLLLTVRFVSCPNQLAFLNNLFNVVDILTVSPFFIRMSVGFVLPIGFPTGWRHRFLLYYVPVIRLLKTMRRFEKLHLLLKAFKVALDALPVLVYLLCCLALSFSVLICLAEAEINPDMKTLPECLWFTIVTMFTVGYGDLTPFTWEGKVATSLLIIATMLYMAVPVGIIGNAFNTTWSDRDRLLLMKKTRDRLEQWGYSAVDIPALFQCADSTDDGELTIAEFRSLIERLQLGFSDERVVQLFTSFDRNGSGTIDDKEFVKALFPNAYYEIYKDVSAQFTPGVVN
mmetsp:Transcript_48532/g.113629  ORF Transcript_48532/g.113629 Transcript_48532/m.113629 type:complete len:611 (+) Transcript_48532:69-1901(+)